MIRLIGIPTVSTFDFFIESGSNVGQIVLPHNLLSYKYSAVLAFKKVKSFLLVLLEQSTMCIDNMISSGSLSEKTSVEVTHKVICGTIVEYKFPAESIVAAVLGTWLTLDKPTLSYPLRLEKRS